MMHRNRRQIELENVFGDIKFNHGFKCFRLKSNGKVRVEFALVALVHNLRKYSTVLSECIMERKTVSVTIQASNTASYRCQ